MGWKKLILILFALFLANIVFAQPFGPPIYIANPNTLECRYYFSGDEKHFNPRPENYTENIGYTTEFKDQDQACLLYRCAKTNGKVLLQDKDDPNPNVCLCPNSFAFINETGCTFIPKATGFAVEEESSENVFNKIGNWILLLIGVVIGFILGAFVGFKFLGKNNKLEIK